MNLDEFINKYQGKKVDFDGAFGSQCVDLFRQYCKDVLDFPHTGAVEGAKDLYEKYDELPIEKDYFVKFTDCPNCGDVVVFGPSRTNKYGHVAIFIAEHHGQLLVFEQDGFKQTGAKFALWPTSRVLGYLAPKF